MNKLLTFFLLLSLVFLAGCSTKGSRVYKSHKYSKPKSYSQPKSYSASSGSHSSVMDKKTYSHPTMRPYTIRGIKYYPTVVSVGDEFSGNASWYGPDFHGKLTSNGETYNMYDMTAAHKTLPMNTIVKVTNKLNGLVTVVRINDRGPFIATRIIDLSNTAAKKIDMIGRGTAPVTLEILGFATTGKTKIPTKKELKSSVQQASLDNFALQIASFSRIEGAMATQEKYNNTDGYKSIIKDMDKDGVRSFKIWLTGFKSEKEARDYKSQGHFENSFIVRED